MSKFLDYSNEKLKDFDFSYDVFPVNFDRTGASTDIEDIVYDIGAASELWGAKNPEPRIHISDINVSQRDINICGKTKDTVRFTYKGITYIKFHAKDLIQQLNEFDRMTLEIIGKCNINEWNGQESPQIVIEECEVNKDNGF